MHFHNHDLSQSVQILESTKTKKNALNCFMQHVDLDSQSYIMFLVLIQIKNC